MTRFLRLTLIATASLLQAESFEVASIAPCPPGSSGSPMEHAGQAQFVQADGRFLAKCTTAIFLFEWAYDLQPTQHSRGPEWFQTERYDIVAKSERPATAAEMKRMTQTLLAERFHLKFHIEKKELPVFVIAAGKSVPKLTASAPSDVESLQMTRLGGPDNNSRTARVIFSRFSIARLADTFARQMDRPILDQTNLPGEFNFTLDLTPDESAPRSIDASMLMTALREQLGLVFKADKASIDYYLIESADKTASWN